MMSVAKQEQDFSECVEKIQKSISADSQLVFAIDFMKDALSTGLKARFRDFWRMKKICLELFKKEIHKTKRSAYWEEYTTLLTEAHALQKILEEQVCFQSEQISLAIEGLVKDWEKKDFEDGKEAPYFFKKLENGKELFAKQKKLAFYHRLREQALSYRKEILSLEIRVSQKNKLLSKLAKISDKIFPERKTLFKEITSQFSEIVMTFMKDHFDMSEKKLLSDAPVYVTREKIKLFQTALRELSIANDAYARMRKEFSVCWDILKQSEQQEKELYEKRKEEAPQVIEGELLEIENIQDEDKFDKVSKILLDQVKERGVSKEAMFLLKKKIADKKDRLEAQIKKEREKRNAEKTKKKMQQEEDFLSSIVALDELAVKAKKMKLEKGLELLDELCAPLLNYTLKNKQQIMLNHKRQIIELILITKREKGGEHVLESYQVLHSEIKVTLEEVKKLKISCGLDIELAFELDEYAAQARLSIHAIEDQIEKMLIAK